MSVRHLDDVALREMFKKVDAATLQRCRRVCHSWNEEILRLNRFTRKFTPQMLLIELTKHQLTLSVNRKSLELTDPEQIANSLCHVAPPRSLNFLIHHEVNSQFFQRISDVLKGKWCSQVKELEISSSSISVVPLFSVLGKFPDLTYLSLSYCSEETVSCSELFTNLPELQNLRLYSFSENGRGLIFDDEAVSDFLENQKETRKIQCIEFFNLDIRISTDTMIEALRKLASAPRVSEEETEVHFLFHNCHWEHIKELELLNSIILVSTEVSFPIPQDPYDNSELLKGDFRFSISGTDFVMKFVV